MESRSKQPVTLAEYIGHLKEIEREFGGALLVQRWLPSLGRHHAPKPQVAYEFIHPVEGVKRGGIITPNFWQPQHDAEKNKGERVVRI